MKPVHIFKVTIHYSSGNDELVVSAKDDVQAREKAIRIDQRLYGNDPDDVEYCEINHESELDG